MLLGLMPFKEDHADAIAAFFLAAGLPVIHVTRRLQHFPHSLPHRTSTLAVDDSAKRQPR